MDYGGFNGLRPWPRPWFDCNGLLCGRRLSPSFLAEVVWISYLSFQVFWWSTTIRINVVDMLRIVVVWPVFTVLCWSWGFIMLGGGGVLYCSSFWKWRTSDLLNFTKFSYNSTTVFDHSHTKWLCNSLARSALIAWAMIWSLDTSGAYALSCRNLW
jgi:hypothetical protein